MFENVCANNLCWLLRLLTQLYIRVHFSLCGIVICLYIYIQRFAGGASVGFCILRTDHVTHFIVEQKLCAAAHSRLSGSDDQRCVFPLQCRFKAS